MNGFTGGNGFYGNSVTTTSAHTTSEAVPLSDQALGLVKLLEEAHHILNELGVAAVQREPELLPPVGTLSAGISVANMQALNLVSRLHMLSSQIGRL